MRLIICLPGDGTQFESFTYPAGESQVRLKSAAAAEIHQSEAVEIHARIHQAQPLMELLLLVDAIRGVKPAGSIILKIPYLPYARADRRFVDGDCHGLKVMGDLLALCAFSEIHTLDVHNPNKAYTHISSLLRNVNSDQLILRAIEDFGEHVESTLNVLLPDAGAIQRYKLPEVHKGVAINILHASKKRDASSGALAGFAVPEKNEFHGNAVLIVDDICDGGGTFIGIAKELSKIGRFDLRLFVTHGIFSAGTAVLQPYFERIYTTNSVITAPLPHQLLSVYDAFAAMESES